MNGLEELLPAHPSFSDLEIAECWECGDFRPLIFELYKGIASIANAISGILPSSPAVARVRSVHFYLLASLLNRCSRLMFASVVLSHENSFAEATAIFDRCITESALKIRWLCEVASENDFDRFIADGLRPELALRQEIEKNIARRPTLVAPIEQRMLNSIINDINASEMTEEDIRAHKKLPTTEQMLIQLSEPSLSYVVQQRLGSHAIHGTWTDLLLHYMDRTGPVINGINFRNCEPYAEKLAVVPLHVARALKSFSNRMLDNSASRELINLIDAHETELVRLLSEYGAYKDAQ